MLSDAGKINAGIRENIAKIRRHHTTCVNLSKSSNTNWFPQPPLPFLDVTNNFTITNGVWEFVNWGLFLSCWTWGNSFGRHFWKKTAFTVRSTHKNRYQEITRSISQQADKNRQGETQIRTNEQQQLVKTKNILCSITRLIPSAKLYHKST